jgi:hypothetical protein
MMAAILLLFVFLITPLPVWALSPVAGTGITLYGGERLSVTAVGTREGL